MIVVVVVAATSHSKICLPMPTPVMCAYLSLGVASGHLSEFVVPHLTFVFLYLLFDYFFSLFCTCKIHAARSPLSLSNDIEMRLLTRTVLDSMNIFKFY